MREMGKASKAALLLTAAAGLPLFAQPAPDNSQIMERLERLEQQNAKLTEEVRQLRTELSALQANNASPPRAPVTATAASSAATEDALAIQQARIDEQAQSKVEAGHKLPMRITGMALFNAFYDTHSDTGYYAGSTGPLYASANAGGTLSQSIVGLEFDSPNSVVGARVHGEIFADFFGSAGSSQTASTLTYGQWPTPRLRTGGVTLDWTSSSFSVGVDKPLISPLTPDSFAQVGVPALSGAGNLWFWEPQARFEQRIHLSERDVVRLQGELISTHESAAYVSPAYASSLAPRRPGWEGRAEFAHKGEDDRGFEFGAGFHLSETHVAGQTVSSNLFSLDGKYWMTRWWNLEGTFFRGQDVAGIGGAGPGFSIVWNEVAQPVHADGGWLQLTLIPASRTSLHFFGGAQNNRSSDLWGDQITSNASFGGNVYYQLAPNVFASFEAAQTRTDWVVSGRHLRNVYDLGLAYLF